MKLIFSTCIYFFFFIKVCHTYVVARQKSREGSGFFRHEEKYKQLVQIYTTTIIYVHTIPENTNVEKTFK